jgi:hypothetical protein
MNKDRRKALADVAGQIEDMIANVSAIREMLEGVRDEEQEYYDNMPESLQGGEKGENSQAAIDAMENVLSELENVESADFSGLSDL